MKHIPLRMCIGCREMHPQNELIRIVKNIDTSKIEFDMNKRLFGRGAYICKNEKCIQLAHKKHGLERQFKCQVPQDLYLKAEELI